MEELRDGKKLLAVLKPKTGAAPAFGGIPFDTIIFNALISGTAATAVGIEPKILILCGPPGCGKSTIKTNLLRENGITNYINIDPDEIRTILMANGVTFPADKTTMPGITNAFNKRMSDEAQRQHLNIVFDTTGQNFKAISDVIYTSNQLGYKSIFTIIYASKETCQRRVQGRNQHLKDTNAGRIELPLEVANFIYDGFMNKPKGTASMLLLDYPVRANETLLYSNDVDGAEPVLLYNKVGANVITKTNFPNFYNMNLSDTEPYISLSRSGGKRSKRRRTKKNNKKSKRKTMRRLR